MPALALQSADDIYLLIRRQQQTPRALSQEADLISANTSEVLSQLFKTDTYERAKIDAVRHLLEHGSGYASLSFIMRKTGLSVADFHQLIHNTGLFKKSFIVTEDGGAVYRLNTSFGGIRDLWKAFCHINAMKF